MNNKSTIEKSLAAIRPASSPSKSEQPAQAVEVVADGSLSTDSEMGRLLTDQYQRALSGMREVLRFGAMMIMLREQIRSTRGLDHATTTGKGAKYEAGTGVDAWLKEFAPDIRKPTAYRFMHIAESVRAEFKIPRLVAKSMDFSALATTPAEELNDRAVKVQLELWEFVDGTSQRSWLDRFVPPKPRGGARGNTHKPYDPLSAEETSRDAINAAWAEFSAAWTKHWKHFPADELVELSRELKTITAKATTQLKRIQ